MSRYTVKQLAKLSGVSVRTLHHYDEIGLLKPAAVGENGYRYYGREELLRLQQILFHRELEFPLEAIRAVLAAPDYDRIETLRRHRQTLAAQARRYRSLIATLDATLAALQGDQTMDDKQLYRGFAPEKQAEYEAWLIDRYGEPMKAKIADSKAKMKKRGLTKAQFDDMQARVNGFEVELAKAMRDGLPIDSDAVREVLKRHQAWLAEVWPNPPSKESYAGLADLYSEHPDFRARYEARAAGLTDYMTAAMRSWAAAG
jgi:DNA-binding transcriptional MerR regulator